MLLMEEIPNNHLACIKPCKSWDKQPTSHYSSYLLIITTHHHHHHHHSLIIIIIIIIIINHLSSLSLQRIFVTSNHPPPGFTLLLGLAASERQDVSEDVSNLATLDVFEEDSNTGDTVGRDAWRIWEVLVFQGLWWWFWGDVSLILKIFGIIPGIDFLLNYSMFRVFSKNSVIHFGGWFLVPSDACVYFCSAFCWNFKYTESVLPDTRLWDQSCFESNVGKISMMFVLRCGLFILCG